MQADHTYQSYSSIFDVVIKNNDLITARAFMTGLYPVMSDLNKEEFTGTIFTNVMSNGTLDMQLLFIDEFGLPQDVAKGYINSCLHDPTKSRELLSQASKYIGENYGAELAGAFVFGDLEVARALFDSNRDRRPVFTQHNGWALIDGNRIQNRSEIMAEVSSDDLRKLTELLADAGMRYVIDDEFRVLGVNSLKNSKSSTKIDPFLGALPMLSSGVLKNPELLIAFQEQAKASKFPAVYSKIPCWVKSGEFENSTEVSVFYISQLLVEKDINQRVKSSVSLTELTSSYGAGQNPVSISNGVFEFHLKHTPFEMVEAGFNSASKVMGISSNVLKEIVPINILSGFDHPDGYQLAVIDMSVLGNFPVVNPSSDALNEANIFANKFFPASVLSNAYSQNTWDVVNDNDIGFDSYDGSDLFRSLQNPLLREKLIEFIPAELWRDIYKKCSRRLVASEIIDAKSTFGLDDSVSRINLDRDSIYSLYNAGYKFSGGGDNCEFDAYETHEEPADVNSYVYFMRMGGWPSKLPRPASVQEGLSFAIRKKNDRIYDFYLLSVGAEEVIKTAKTPAQFNYIYEVFPREEITPLLRLMPGSLRGRHLEDDLGM